MNTIRYTSNGNNKWGLVQGNRIEYVEKAQPNKAVGCFIGLVAIGLLIASILFVMVL
jgi:hypothetical protein